MSFFQRILTFFGAASLQQEEKVEPRLLGKCSRSEMNILKSYHFEQIARSTDLPAKAGYLEVRNGEVFNERYIALKRIGKGYFSTVWLAEDRTTSGLVALKISKPNSSFLEAALGEIDAYSFIQASRLQSDRVIKMIDHFMYRGRRVIVLEIMGPSLATYLEAFDCSRFFLPTLKEFLKQILEGLVFLHENQIIHSDLKPENILVAPTKSYLRELNPSERMSIFRRGLRYFGNRARFNLGPNLRIKIGDLGSSEFATMKWEPHLIQTRPYRAPEVILQQRWGKSVDMWSLGCVAFELATGRMLFPPIGNSEYLKDRNHIQLIYQTIGNFPLFMTVKGRGSKFFRLKRLRFYDEDIDAGEIEDELVKYLNWSDEDLASFSKLLRGMLMINPNKRITAKAALQYDWLRK